MVKLGKYNYTSVAYCDKCGRITFSLYFFQFSAFQYLCSRRKFCADCASQLIDKYDMKVEVKSYE